MDLILCHTTADFDALGAAVGLTRLYPNSKVVLSGGAHPGVRDFLALHRDEYQIIERRSVREDQIDRLMVVDTQRRSRLGKAAAWLDLPHLREIILYDHHCGLEGDIPANIAHIEAVGATSTLVVEELQKQKISLSPAEATVLALGIHVDTGSLSYEQSTARDAIALAWLMEQNASLAVIRDYLDPGLSPPLQRLFSESLEQLQTTNCQGYKVSWILVSTEGYLPGLSSLTSRLLEVSESDALLLAAEYPVGEEGEEKRTIVIGRSRIEGTNLNLLLAPLGGGGHSQAASLTLRGVHPQETLDQLVQQLIAQIPHPPTARELMSSPVRTIRPETTVGEAQRILLRYGNSGLCVVTPQDDEGKQVSKQVSLVGVISRRDIDLALHHGFSHAPVKGYMTSQPRTISPETSLPEIESLMVTYDIGRLPVLENGQLVGIVTRTDVLRQLHQCRAEECFRSDRSDRPDTDILPLNSLSIQQLQNALAAPLWQLLTCAAQEAEKRGWHLYLVGGAVRDLLLANPQEPVFLSDIDLVVDGGYNTVEVGAGVSLAKALQETYSHSRLEVHGAFQTAALLWHKDPVLGSLWVDIATARTEFYPYPAANPEVEASSIRQDLYRRDFTINALAVRLTEYRSGNNNAPRPNKELPLLDFFGGLLDLKDRKIRVLHANSFIEDPTRIYRAVRFAVRLGFQIEEQTEVYIRYALESGVYERSLQENAKAPALQTRLKAELKHILEAPYWQSALKLIADLGALRCIHPNLNLTEHLWRQIRQVNRALQKFDDSENLTHWQIRLEVLLASLTTENRLFVAQNLQLPNDSIERLKKLDQAAQKVADALPKLSQPSEISHLLRPYDVPTLVLIASGAGKDQMCLERPLRRKIWQYLSQWSQVQPMLNGHDLKVLGYKPGPNFKLILNDILAATLDGKLKNFAEAEDFLKANYPK